MARRIAALRTKYQNTKLDELRTSSLDEIRWRVFLAYVRDAHSLRHISMETGLPVFKLSLIISEVDRALSAARDPERTRRLDLDAPIEDLMLSMRARNTLRELGCDTVRSVIERDFSKAVRRFGPVTRQEVVSALAESGFTPPLSLTSRQLTVSELGWHVSKLRQKIELSYRCWLDEVERLEDRIGKLSKAIE